MSLDWCKKAETGLPKPDAVFFLSLSPEAVSQRDGFGNERYELSEIQMKVRNNFMELADDTWHVCTSLEYRNYFSSVSGRIIQVLCVIYIIISCTHCLH
jgi:dTMP kinase